ncbi:hypothetical protein K504DRAFT_530724 [Pleomassaria siparia CBS 279.74]|uniref:Rhodopsin domain-containing protein n=1 Tax=Pleomassaria siparia CBS 279.74 TaxID=1314801 RepID=A0A6G1KMM8_9PLEO|nr:hypothetical protein K504DRAFT_530724 [Pleomassaria siparia CBS 279.74]
MASTPLRIPPAGVTANFDDISYLGLPVLVTSGLCLCIVFLFAAVRFYATVIVLKKWKLEDYVFFCSFAAGMAFIALQISLIKCEPIGHHAWNIFEQSMTKAALVHLLAFSIGLGPVLWLLKLSLFCFVLRHFGSVRWVKNCVYVGIIFLGIVFSAYTLIVTMACGPKNGLDLKAYLHGLNRSHCSSPNGATAIVSVFTGTVNGVGDLYLILISMPLISSLRLTKRQMYGVYLTQISGVLICLCSLLGVYYRYRSWQTTDITGGQMPLYIVLALEITLGLMIPCMPSFATLWRYYAHPDINDTGILAPTPKVPLVGSLSFPSKLPQSERESRTTWRKTHLSIEEIPYRKPSAEWTHNSIRTPQSAHVQRMKALPATPLPTTPGSPQYMHLPIMFSR